MEKNLQIIFKGSAIILAGMLYGHLLTLAFRMIIARHFGKVTYGELSIGLSIVVIFVQISSLGLTQGIPMFVSMMCKKKEYRDLYVICRFGLKLMIISSLILASVIILASNQLRDFFNARAGFPLLMVLLALVIPFQNIANYCLAVLRGLKNMTAIVLCDDVVNRTSLVIIILIVMLLDLSIYAVPIALIVSFLLAIILSTAFLKKYYFDFCLSPFPGEKLQTLSVNLNLRKKVITHSLPLAFSSVSSILRQRLDVLIVGFFLSPGDAGVYYAAMPIAMTLTALQYVVGRIFMPVLTEISMGNNDTELYELYESTARIISLVIIPISSFLMWFSDEVVFSLFGNDFKGAGAVLRIAIPGILIFIISGNFGAILQSNGHTKAVLYVSICGTLLNLSLMYKLVPLLGISGAAIAVCLSFSAMALAGLHFVYRFFHFHPFSSLLIKGLILGFSSFLGLYLLYLNFETPSVRLKLALFCGAMIIYMLIVIAFNLIKKEESSVFMKLAKTAVNPILDKLGRSAT